MKTLQKLLSTEHYNVPSIEKMDFLAYAKSQEQEKFYLELGLALRNCDGMFQITYHASDLRLDDVLNVIPVQDIISIEIKQNKESINHITFFDLDITLPDGVIHLSTNWCLWKHSRCLELVNGMLVPLCFMKLENKVMSDSGMIFFQSNDKVVMDLINFGKSKNPNQFHAEQTQPEDNLSVYATYLDKAQEVAKETVNDLPEFMRDDFSFQEQQRWSLQQKLLDLR